MHYKEPIAKLIATAKPSFWRSLPSPPSSLRSPAPHSEGPPDLLHVSAAYFFKYVVAAATGWLRQPSLPVRFRSPAFALPSSLFAHLLLHCPVRYSLTCFCTAQFAIRSPAFALPSSLFAHLLLHCPVRYSLTCFCAANVHRTFSCRKQPQDLLVSKAATGPSRVESSHRTFSCRKQPRKSSIF